MQHFHPRLLLLLHSTQGQGGLLAPFCPVLEAPKILPPPHRASRASHPSPQSPEPFSFLLPRSKAVRRNKRPQVAERCHHLLGAGTGFACGCKGHNRTVAGGKTLRQSISAGRVQVNSSRAPFSSTAAESVGKCSAPNSLLPSVPP